ncbi:hypothetical protein [Massiliimalia timonensis]|uniref:hypothetical protein n=1 Tax=Massiliimalia timonensis TaxID=1987501 RepID=UPI0018A0A30C|nr:hypothetical protein [Massiliimalia timonensis]
MNSLLKRIGKLEGRIKPHEAEWWWIMTDGSEVPITDETDPVLICGGEIKDFYPVSFRYVGDMDLLTLSILTSAVDRAQKGR